MKESEKIDKYLDLARELRKLWNKKVIMVIVIGALVTVLKGLENRLDELEIQVWIKTIQTIQQC